MSDKKHSYVGVIVASIASLLIFVFAGWLLFNRTFVADQVSVWAYRTPPNVQALEDRIDFTDKGKFYFQTTQPSVTTADEFNKGCPRQEMGSPILGCYVEGKIYIFDITNNQLDGIEEVTAAHETLHAIWERMGASQQKRIGTLLRNEYSKLADPELKERMDYYSRTEPGEFENELHSIIGTEVGNLSPELTQYYAQYFKDRQKILDLHAKYSAVFKSLSTQSESLYNELIDLGKTIETQSTKYDADVTQLSSDITSFNNRANSGSFSSIDQFNRERAALETRSNQLETDYTTINNEINSYNEKYDRYQALATQIESLNKSIDSIHNLDPAPSL